MHQPIRDGLEDYLAGREHPQFNAHLAACTECRDNVNRIIRQNEMLRLLRVQSAETAPSPGFYARVIDRIEAQKRQSFWFLFLEPLFFRRLLYASLALLLLLGVSLFNAGPPPPDLVADTGAPEEIFAVEESQPQPVHLVDQEQDRNAVLVQLTSY
jgi:hypothetical protein